MHNFYDIMDKRNLIILPENNEFLTMIYFSFSIF